MHWSWACTCSCVWTRNTKPSSHLSACWAPVDASADPVGGDGANLTSDTSSLDKLPWGRQGVSTPADVCGVQAANGRTLGGSRDRGDKNAQQEKNKVSPVFLLTLDVLFFLCFLLFFAYQSLPAETTCPKTLYDSTLSQPGRGFLSAMSFDVWRHLGALDSCPLWISSRSLSAAGSFSLKVEESKQKQKARLETQTNPVDFLFQRSIILFQKMSDLMDSTLWWKFHHMFL